MASSRRRRRQTIKQTSNRTQTQKGFGLISSKTSKRLSSWRLTEDGIILPLYETYRGLPFFRKEHPWPLERQIAQRIHDNPHPNIVSIYRVGDKEIDMEYLKPVHSIHESDLVQLSAAKQHLQSLGIAYLDWKLDNLGRSMGGNIKVFDFNMSALGNDRPLMGVAWREAIINKNNSEIMNVDNAIFHSFIERSRLM